MILFQALHKYLLVPYLTSEKESTSQSFPKIFTKISETFFIFYFLKKYYNIFEENIYFKEEADIKIIYDFCCYLFNPVYLSTAPHLSYSKGMVPGSESFLISSSEILVVRFSY